MKGLMCKVSTPPLIRVSCYDGKEKIGLTNYSDMVIYDKEKTLVAIRLAAKPLKIKIQCFIYPIKNSRSRPFYKWAALIWKISPYCIDKQLIKC